ncbi:hypothetical protein BJ875DRAFT_380210, partial [Amylocarpus encephaloides]
RELVIRPLKLVKLDKPLSLSFFLLIIDTLNKYNNEDYIYIILRLLAKARLLLTIRLRVFLISRPKVLI